MVHGQVHKFTALWCGQIADGSTLLANIAQMGERKTFR